MQKYKEINGNDYVKNSRTTINETMQSIQSMNSGTAFPTNNLFEGMKCYRTDLKKTYTLTDVENNTWVEDAHATLSDEATHAASATKLQTARSLNLGGAVTADAATFDGTADATINVKTLDASKLKGTAPVSTTGNAATASKLATPRTLSLTGKAAGSTSFDGSANASINVTSVNADTATKLSTARKINITGNATGSGTFDGSGDISINTTVSQAAHADKAKLLDGFNGYDDGGWGTTIGKVINGFQESGGGSIQWRADGGMIYQKVDGTYWQREGAYEVIDTSTVNNYAPTKTGSGASGTWDINISGTATNADKLDGYHASDLLKKIAAANTVGIVAASLTENGYAKFANGLILQWGNASGDDEGGNSNSTFPIAFPSMCFVVLVTQTRYKGGAALSNKSNTGFTWSARGGQISWAALGI
ncbi:hypothetical protein [uncultured Selenomonas sp.]|jgi:hypothetical protein|uniref:gp53-like domain-containing protein n=1 Tax=uncultured Selenomonas sp. TaxID=159275 RepID=UPI0028060606|nr:hypothetical protein [uncultured Selenomonas sp.]